MKVFETTFTVVTENRTQLGDITKRVREALRESAITSGLAVVNTLHTTCGVFVNEYQGALMHDLLRVASRLVPERDGYLHNDARFSDCERGNADAHLRTALLGRSASLGVNEGELALGQFQSVIFAEFDGPRTRTVHVQILGE